MAKRMSENSQQLDDTPQKCDKGKQPITHNHSTSVTPEVVRTNHSLMLQQQLSGENALKAMYSDDRSSTTSPAPPSPKQVPERYPLNIRWSFEGHRESITIPQFGIQLQCRIVRCIGKQQKSHLSTMLAVNTRVMRAISLPTLDLLDLFTVLAYKLDH
ncbi:uncharacterized protein EKO05_0006357 [Ascochyta rabiei]|uniref:Uncharacterized protein n=1 Tax=Didymella rabiei TaxID=5454 RepID=A0A163A0B6_DIDRA|nr:uncharacterized protein EKO05_0006357 [Ascochyta rabiei]KZM20909.1 hypothetical protein ST47_g7934 [Ascochyta rabiei]UPX15926.1 hypothetical protein EKO05_0006357 [Ascochyta rabiei]